MRPRRSNAVRIHRWRKGRVANSKRSSAALLLLLLLLLLTLRTAAVGMSVHCRARDPQRVVVGMSSSSSSRRSSSDARYGPIEGGACEGKVEIGAIIIVFIFVGAVVKGAAKSCGDDNLVGRCSCCCNPSTSYSSLWRSR